MIHLLSNAAKCAPIPKKMLKAVATPHHLQLLIELLTVVSPSSKLMMLKIIESFIKNDIPVEVFNQAVKSSFFKDELSLVYVPKNAFSRFLYEYSLRIRMAFYSVKGKEQ